MTKEVFVRAVETWISHIHSNDKDGPNRAGTQKVSKQSPSVVTERLLIDSIIGVTQQIASQEPALGPEFHRMAEVPAERNSH